MGAHQSKHARGEAEPMSPALSTLMTQRINVKPFKRKRPRRGYIWLRVFAFLIIVVAVALASVVLVLNSRWDSRVSNRDDRSTVHCVPIHGGDRWQWACSKSPIELVPDVQHI